MLSLMMAAAVAATPVAPASEWGRDISPWVLRNALRAPERKAKGVKYCFLDDVTTPGEVRKVCRTRQQWASRGLRPNT